MPKRISNDIDIQILADIGLGILNKDIATRYGVSPSYVSKVATGKKNFNIRVPVSNELLEDDIPMLEEDIATITAFIDKQHVLTSDSDIVKFLQSQINKSIVRVKIYRELLKKYKGEN